jgi:hypothetical protein
MHELTALPMEPMKHGARTTAVFLVWTAAACGSGRGDYTAAAVGLGAAVVYTAVHRGVTGDCWARCGYGMLCDRRTGLCVEGECAPGCPVGRKCVRELDGRSQCVDEALAKSFGARGGADGGSPAASSETDAGADSPGGDASAFIEQDGGSEPSPAPGH